MIDLIWYQCQDCKYGTNSVDKAAEHVQTTGHKVEETLEDEL